MRNTQRQKKYSEPLKFPFWGKCKKIIGNRILNRDDKKQKGT